MMDEIKDTKSSKKIRMLLTSKDVRTSIYYTIRVQDKIKDLRSILGWIRKSLLF